MKHRNVAKKYGVTREVSALTTDETPSNATTELSIDWSQYPPTLDGDEVDEILKIGRSRRGELINPQHPRHCPGFPAGFKLFNSPQSRRIWWTKDIAMFVEKRAKEWELQKGGVPQ